MAIRINELSTSWGEKDLRMVRKLAPVAAVVPKEEDRSVVEDAVTIGGVPLLLMIETAKHAPHGVRRQVRHPPYSSPTD